MIDSVEGRTQRSFLCCGKRGGSAVHGPTGTKRTASDSGFNEADIPNNNPQKKQPFLLHSNHRFLTLIPNNRATMVCFIFSPSCIQIYADAVSNRLFSQHQYALGGAKQCSHVNSGRSPAPGLKPCSRPFQSSQILEPSIQPLNRTMFALSTNLLTSYTSSSSRTANPTSFKTLIAFIFSPK